MRLKSRQTHTLVVDIGRIHAQPQTIRPARGLGRLVVEVPHGQAAVITPPDPGTIDRVVPIHGGRQVGARRGVELAGAVLTIADLVAPQPAPTVVGKAFDVIAFGDLTQDAGQIFVVIRAVDAGHIAVAGAIGIAVLITGKPVRVGLEEVLGGAVGIHAGQDYQPIGLGRGGQVAKQIACAEILGAIVKREAAGIVGHDAAGVDDHPLDIGTAPKISPPVNIVADGIPFGDIGLSPAQGACVPRFVRRLGAGRSHWPILCVLFWLLPLQARERNGESILDPCYKFHKQCGRKRRVLTTAAWRHGRRANLADELAT